jgi:ABC-type glycerol-3-phosphate transport system permease component
MTGQRWFSAVGWRHVVGIVAIIFAVVPILFVASAAFNPLGTLSSTSLIPTQFGLARASEAFNEDGSLKDPTHQKSVDSVASELVRIAGRLKG